MMARAQSDQPPLPRIVLHPGEYRVASEPVLMSTLLGSCVAVCLYDPVKRIMGMNHFLLANERYPRGAGLLASEAGRYGLQAMELLINALLRLGARRASLQAKAFGGGNVLAVHRGEADGFFAVGEVNTRFVREFLRQDGIPLVAEDLGGTQGRQIHFDGSDYAVYLRRIGTAQEQRINAEERRYWQADLERHRQAAHQARADFW
jgi:chemotaxis protein CheD